MKAKVVQIASICRVCRSVGETINADCGHEVHASCCHSSRVDSLGVTVCLFCWHEPVAILKRAGVEL